jgi:hypothetical protein
LAQITESDLTQPPLIALECKSLPHGRLRKHAPHEVAMFVLKC